jgi:hypothetical protein
MTADGIILHANAANIATFPAKPGLEIPASQTASHLILAEEGGIQSVNAGHDPP